MSPLISNITAFLICDFEMQKTLFQLFCAANLMFHILSITAWNTCAPFASPRRLCHKSSFYTIGCGCNDCFSIIEFHSIRFGGFIFFLHFYSPFGSQSGKCQTPFLTKYLVRLHKSIGCFPASPYARIFAAQLLQILSYAQPSHSGTLGQWLASKLICFHAS